MKKLFLALFSAFVLLCLTQPAVAVDWSFYGSARMATYYVTVDGGDVRDNQDDLQWDLQGNSRIGADVTAEAVSGKFELGLKGDQNGDVNVGTRRIYGVWDFGAGKLKVGKDYTPVAQWISNQVFDADNGMQGYGTAYGYRIGQVSLSFGGLEVALITPTSKFLEGTTAPDNGNLREIVPKVEAVYSRTMAAFEFAVQGGFNYYQQQNVVTASGQSNDIDVYSWTIGGDAGFNIGPAYVKGALSYGQNVGNANWDYPNNFGVQGGLAEWNGNDGTNDVSTFMAGLVAGFKMSDRLTFEAGAGYRLDDCGDLEATNAAGKRGNKDDDFWQVYGQALITLAKGVYLVPEVGYYDYMDDNFGESEGHQIYVGGKWQIDF